MSYYEIMLYEEENYWRVRDSIVNAAATGESKSDALRNLADEIEE